MAEIPGSNPGGPTKNSGDMSNLDDDGISQDSAAYRKWKEGSSKVISQNSDKPLYETTGVELSTPAFLQNQKAKTIFGIVMPLWGMAPYISYPVWIIFFAPLRILEGLVRLLIGGKATTPNIQFDVWVFGSGGAAGQRKEPTIWGDWWGFGGSGTSSLSDGVAGYLPSLEGFLLLFLYSYFWLNIFTPTFRPLRIIFLGLCFFYIMAFSHLYIPEGWTHYS